MEKNKTNSTPQAHPNPLFQDIGLRKALRQIDEEAKQTVLSDGFEERLMNAIGQDDIHENNESYNAPHRHSLGSTHIVLMRRVAAALLVLITVSGLAYSVYRFSSSTREDSQTVEKKDEVGTNHKSMSSVPLFHFENVRLDSLLNVVAENYHCTLVFTDAQPRELRISTTWQPQQSLSTFVNVMNELDEFQLVVREDTIFVVQKSLKEE